MPREPFSRRTILASLAVLTAAFKPRGAQAAPRPADPGARMAGGINGEESTLRRLGGERGSALVTFKAPADEAEPQTVEFKLGQTISVKDFGAKGDGETDDTAAFTRGIHHCQGQSRTLYVPPGIYKITDTLVIAPGAGGPITIVGDQDCPMQQGSTGPSTILRWHGAQAPVFALSVSGTAIIGLAVQNFGAATDAFDVTGGQHFFFKRLSFLPLDRSKRFTRSIFHMIDGSFGYGRWETMWFASAAPKFIFVDGGSGGGTPFEISGRSVFESHGVFGPCSVIHIRDMASDSLIIRDSTFNQQANAELRIVDTTDAAKAAVLTNLTFSNNEIDIVSSNSGDRPFVLQNCRNIRFDSNSIQGGSIGAIVRLVDSTVTRFDSNYCRSAGKVRLGFFEMRGSSRVFAGVNQFELATMEAGLFDGDAALCGVDPILMVDQNAFLDLSHSSPTGNGTYRLSMTRNAPANLIVSSMSDSRRGMPTRGQEFTLQIENRSTAVLTGLSAQPNFKLAPRALAGIAPGTVRSLRMLFDGRNVQQITPALDIPL